MKEIFNRWFKSRAIRWKLLILVLPLVILPIVLVASVVGYIANRQAYLGITQTSKDDLQHSAAFTIDLLNSHYQQFQVYKQDKINSFRTELATLTNLSHNLVSSEYNQFSKGRISKETAIHEARLALKKVNVGGNGYIYAMTGDGKLQVHIAREGENVSNERDENGRYFIKEMCAKARKSKPGEVLFITYPWRNLALGDEIPRSKVVAYRYFPQWDWVIATGGYLDETARDADFERKSFAALKEKIRSKKIGSTGYIFCMDSKGNFTIHPDGEGKNHLDARDSSGFPFIKEMCRQKTGWIRYPWKNLTDSRPRMKIVRYEYFQPWDWIVAVGSYEDEFYHEAQQIKGRIIYSMIGLMLIAGLMASIMVFKVSTVITQPLQRMIEVIRKVKKGNFDENMAVEGQDELAEMAAAFNRMTGMIKHNREMEATLAQQGKMASLGVLSSGVAHEINNPLGVILGYAGYIEGKMSSDDPNYNYIHEIKRESKRCKKIVQDLLSYARTPRPQLELINLCELLKEIVDFAANHTDMRNVTIHTDFAQKIPNVMLDGDQMRQVAINLILNAGGAMPKGGELHISAEQVDERYVRISFKDNGCGIPSENLEKIFEPFYTTKERGTGLGLAITRQIIEQHHGEISIKSEQGCGTTVMLLLPFVPDEL